MINKVTNTQCRSKFLFFLLTLLQKLKQFPFRNFKRDFFIQILFSTVFGEEDEKGRLGRAQSARWTPCFAFLCQDVAFFPQRSEMSILQLKPPFNEFRTRANEQEFTLVWQDSRWVLWLVRFCFLWWVTQGNLPIPDFVCDKSYPLKVSKRGILNPS